MALTAQCVARRTKIVLQRQFSDQLLEGATGVFGEATKAEPEPVIDVKTLHAKIVERALENDFLSGALGKAGLLPSVKR